MNKIITGTHIAITIWLGTWLSLSIGVFAYVLYKDPVDAIIALIISAVLSALVSIPALLILFYTVERIQACRISLLQKQTLLLSSLLCICLLYGLIIGFFTDIQGNELPDWDDFYYTTGGFTAALFMASAIAYGVQLQTIKQYFNISNFSTKQINTNMDNYQLEPQGPAANNKTLIKAIVTGILILVMLIPTLFVSGLVTERQQRQEEVVAEVSSKWSARQTISGPYIYLPYTSTEKTAEGKLIKHNEHLWLLPENLHVKSSITPEERPRSIYKVLLYKSNSTASGNFNIQLPEALDSAQIQFNAARICVGISDFKGIEQKLNITANGSAVNLTAGLPANGIDTTTTGLSAPIQLTAADMGKNIAFNMDIALKGSEQLHFLPLAGNSDFIVQSSWANPSFDGSVLPGERTITENGFTAKWTFNNANLPFGTSISALNIGKEDLAFGVTMVQPADQYAKTTRSVKYAILFIGLTFCLFFIIEMMQKKPFHPVQYVLVGLALTIFYTLLLSISEFLLFDTAYLIAAMATILLITLYAKGHFASWKVAGIFAGILTALYGFIFILIRLEDTALLVGSIGLFAVLALVMYASRKVNWYNPSFQPAQPGSM